MEFAQKYWTFIKAQLEGLSLSTKWLIGALLTILLLVGFIAMLYAGRPEMVPITPFATDRTEDVLARLNAAGIEVEQRGSQVLVPIDQRDDALAMLVQDNLLTEDASAAFAELVGNPWETNAQGERKYLIATQRVLSNIVTRMQGVRSAEVVISLPREQGFGRTHVQPSASVTVTMQGSSSVNKHMVQALAGLVSGAIAEMRPQDVVVIDANHGRQHTIADEDEMLPTDVLELVHHQERYHRDKIQQLLQTIPQVIVAVKVMTDPVHREVREETQYEETEPLRREMTHETTSTDFAEGGEAGARPNTMLDINGGGGVTSEHSEIQTESEFADKRPEVEARLRRHKKVRLLYHLGEAFEGFEYARALDETERRGIRMSRISFTNNLLGGEADKRDQRRDARFVNTAMMMSLLGAAVSDALEDGRVVSGVGGQYNFVAMAHALPDGRSVILARSTRGAGRALESNIVWDYGSLTIPRHLRDVVVTEYGVADLRESALNKVREGVMSLEEANRVTVD